MFCPKCKAEYREGYTICSDCDVPLVHELPPEPEIEYGEYECILATCSPTDRALLKSIFDAEGIKYYFDGEHAAPYIYYAVPVRLLVEKDQVSKAIDILKDINLSFVAGGTITNSEDIRDE